MKENLEKFTQMIENLADKKEVSFEEVGELNDMYHACVDSLLRRNRDWD